MCISSNLMNLDGPIKSKILNFLRDLFKVRTLIHEWPIYVRFTLYIVDFALDIIIWRFNYLFKLMLLLRLRKTGKILCHMTYLHGL